MLRNAGLPVAGPLFDTMIAAFVVDPTRGSYNLDGLSLSLFGHTKIPDQRPDRQGPRATAHGPGAGSSTSPSTPREDADYTWRLRQLFEPQLAPLGVDRLFYDTEMPLVSVLTDMEQHGIRA